MSETYTTDNALVLEYTSKSGAKTITKTVYTEKRMDAYWHAIMRTKASDPLGIMLLETDGSPNTLPWLQDGEMHELVIQQVRISGDTVERIGQPVTVNGRLRRPTDDELAIIRQVCGK